MDLILQGQKSLNFCVWLHSLFFKTSFSKASHYKGKMFFIGTFMISIPVCFSEILGVVTGKQVEGNKAGGKRCYFFLGVGGGLLALDCCKQAFL